MHLGCWRVPNRVWLGLPDPTKCSDVGAFQSALRGMGAVLLSGLTLTPTPTLTPTLTLTLTLIPNPNQVLLSGLAELSGSEMRKLAHVCMNR